jgi:transposase
LSVLVLSVANFFAGTHRRPTWRKAGVHEGFRGVGVRGRAWEVRRLSRRTGQVRVPKVGWVRFRWSRPVPAGVKSFRVTRDRAGRWHVAFAAVPDPVPAPGNGEAVGVDQGVAVGAALSTGQTSTVPGLTREEAERLDRLLRGLARSKRGSNRRARVKAAIARLKAREADRRKDGVEKTSTGLARRFGVIAVEDLNTAAMTRSGKGPVDADVNAARNIRDTAVGRTVAARGGRAAARPVNREPQPALLPV